MMEEDPKSDLETLLYNKIDQGLYKRDAREIVDAIEKLIDHKIKEALSRGIK